MITIDSVLSKKNKAAAFNHLSIKQNGGGTDKAELTELREYWESNGERIEQEIRECRYEPGLIMEYEIVSGSGKKRMVNRMNMIDKFITRLLAQKLNHFYCPLFLHRSYAYQDGKGIQTAVEQARDYIEQGNEFVIKLDIQSFFDEICLERLMLVLEEEISDQAVLHLLGQYLHCTVSRDGDNYLKDKGLVQGSPMSPVLSNLYFHKLDKLFEERGYNWLRFADDISIYVSSMDLGKTIYDDVVDILEKDFLLPINIQKSGVYDAYDRWLLGYEFHKRNGKVIINRHQYQNKSHYREWHPSVVKRVNSVYHIVQGGVLNKKDYALLFENKEEKHHIPVEATEQINLYNEVVISSPVLRTLSQENIKLNFMDKYGNLQGSFVPFGHQQDAKTVVAQCVIYADSKKRLVIARKIEIAAIHNIRANLRYYLKQGKELDTQISELTDGIKRMNECKSVEELLLEEAHCRQQYYQAFNTILGKEDFIFTKRTKRPPMDEINALISFGNTVLYNKVQQIIWKTSLDIRIGIFHAANRRACSLNLDFADLFKPITVDRVIFSLINRGQITKKDFVANNDGSVYLNDSGKKLFLENFESKMHDRLNVKDKQVTYHQLIEGEIRAYLRYVTKGEKYNPYKYY